MLSPDELRQAYFDFFVERSHALIPSAPLVPENDPTTLFNNSGMQPLVPYLLGQPHPKGTRLVDSQRCFRSVDIEEVGDSSHTTYFEMLGNWSLGDYFKKEQLAWFFEFLTDVVGLDPENLYVTVYRGNKELNIPRDDEAVEIWQELFKSKGIEAKVVDNSWENGMQDGRIFYYDEEDNWWSRSGLPNNMPVGEIGGPSSEVFYDFGEEYSKDFDDVLHLNSDCLRFLEIGNSVFMTYEKTENGFQPLKNKNIDFGGGFERILAAKNDDPDIFKTKIFQPIIKKIEELSGKSYEGNEQAFRVIADHLRAASMLAVDGVLPGNKAQGYFSRRLIRRAIRYGKKLGIEGSFVAVISSLSADKAGEVEKSLKKPEAKIQHAMAAMPWKPESINEKLRIKNAFEKEEAKFNKTLEKGLKEFEKQVGETLTAELAFTLFETYGFPLELSIEEAESRCIAVSNKIHKKFDKLREEHARVSRKASAGMFRGGLADSSEQTVRYHTATHLLHAALRKILGEVVEQKGSNITFERLRFDFSFSRAMTEDEKQKVELQINKWIKADLPVWRTVKNKAQALKEGAIAFFVEKYPEEVSVYTIGNDEDKDWISKELCGGPHVERTGEIGSIRLTKEKSIGSGVRRVYLESQT